MMMTADHDDALTRSTLTSFVCFSNTHAHVRKLGLRSFCSHLDLALLSPRQGRPAPRGHSHSATMAKMWDLSNPAWTVTLSVWRVGSYPIEPLEPRGRPPKLNLIVTPGIRPNNNRNGSIKFCHQLAMFCIKFPILQLSTIESSGGVEVSDVLIRFDPSLSDGDGHPMRLVGNGAVDAVQLIDSLVHDFHNMFRCEADGEVRGRKERHLDHCNVKLGRDGHILGIPIGSAEGRRGPVSQRGGANEQESHLVSAQLATRGVQ
jgi:hypothetical protein